MKLHPFGSIETAYDLLSGRDDRVVVGSRWEMRGLDRGPDNDFTVTSVAPPLRPGEYAISEYRPTVSYRRTGSDDEPTHRDYGDFLSNFMLYGTVVTGLEKMTVTAKRPSGGFPWLLLAAGAALLLS